jgi:hypothetical protein
MLRKEQRRHERRSTLRRRLLAGSTAVVLALVAVAWALAIAFTSPEVPPLRALVGDWEMRAAGIEERRETLGLLLLALWAAVVALPSAKYANISVR